MRALSSTSEDTSESSIGSEELQRQIAVSREADGGPSITSGDVPPLSSDEQPDANTTLIGWDFSAGDPGDRPHQGLANLEMVDYLRVRGASDAYMRLRTLGVEVPNDLQNSCT